MDKSWEDGLGWGAGTKHTWTAKLEKTAILLEENLKNTIIRNCRPRNQNQIQILCNIIGHTYILGSVCQLLFWCGNCMGSVWELAELQRNVMTQSVQWKMQARDLWESIMCWCTNWQRSLWVAALVEKLLTLVHTCVKLRRMLLFVLRCFCSGPYWAVFFVQGKSILPYRLIVSLDCFGLSVNWCLKK